ncbi:unnamed protein product [Paramecium pentaurelia]|uniref:Uncharacterized protein n=1 Tax=Paramecium pentaurelia TaxID=43138 RepID=A0A8S1Y299_9CILI|nr:unnamed protein product [Paramecium pentaurelia]
MKNCQQNQRQNFYNFVFGYNKDQRSTSMKVERLRQITETSEIKQDYYKGLQLGKTSENALKVIHMKLERQRLRRQSFETKTEMEEEHLPQVQYPVKPPIPHRTIVSNKENIIEMPYNLAKQQQFQKLYQIKRRRQSQRMKIKKSEPTIDFSPWENEDNHEFDFY